ADQERRRLFGDGFVSIFSLFRDGRELASRLREVRSMPSAEQADGLAAITDPYLVFFDETDLCPHTGLRLMDVWRYFRHTWANQYTSVPGRTMMFLVRDRAAPRHPVVGIGSISSPIVQIRERDIWIGWHPESLLEEIQERPTAKHGKWLKGIVGQALDELYVQDFLEESDADHLLTPSELQDPTPDVIERLRAHARKHRELHQQYPDQNEHKGVEGGRVATGTWEDRARSNLFISKRAAALADLLEARRDLATHLGERPTKDEVAALARDRSMQRTLLKVFRKAKADRVGVAMADITVCGAIPPYGALLGGKLVSLLAGSPELVAAYRKRYSGAESEIASAMAGRAIKRPAELVFLGTTSLYGRSAQYNRVRMPGEQLGGEPGTELRFVPLGESEAYGTSHFSAETLRLFDAVLRRSERGQRVNNIFGEGTSPKLRKVRDGLSHLGFPVALLKHHRRRELYGVPLASNLKEYLIGMSPRPRYLFPRAGAESTSAISAWWRERWVSKRLHSDQVLESVETHTLTSPIRHGARIQLPPEHPDRLDPFNE
ncbi:MAG: DUF4338 domain-containing protein, partial [Myxococcales bacterium]|nr:DUF4338 domain-containing protein [Myxococcales bacterium]